MSTNKDWLLSKRVPLLAAGLISLIAFIAYRDYLLFHKIFFFKGICSDNYSLNYPYIHNGADYISRYGIPSWSFRAGMGQSIFPFFLRDPFDIFLYLPPGKNHIFFAWVYLEFAKILFGGLIFYYYLKALKLSDYTSLTGSLLYAFCGFMILGSIWSLFSFETFNMALLLLAFELLFTKQKWFLFPFAVFLICISQPFNLYVYGLFLAAYAILRLVQTSTFNARNTLLIYAKMAGLTVLGMLLSGPFLIENILQILESPRGSGLNTHANVLTATPIFATADKLQLSTAALRLFSNVLAGTADHFKGWYSILEAPIFYCGLPCLLLMPQLFHFLERRIKIAFILFITIWLLPTIFPYFRYAFWLFSGDYYRAYSFFVAFFILYYALQALEYIIHKREISITTLIITVVVLFCMLNYPHLQGKSLFHYPEKPVRAVYFFVSILLIVYSAIFFYWGRHNSSRYLKYIFLLALVSELSVLSYITVHKIGETNAAELAQRTGYNDYTLEAVNYLNQTDPSFYRIDKDYFSNPARWYYSPNDAMAQGYRGTGSYAVFNQLHYVMYMQLLGTIDKENEVASRWTYGLASRPLLESENQVKYFLTKTSLTPFYKITFDSLARFGDVSLFRNKYALPFGYTYAYYIKESLFTNLSNDQKDYTSLKACVVKDKDAGKLQGMKPFSLTDTIAPAAFDTTFYRNAVNELSKDTLSVSKFGETLISGTIDLSEAKMMYLSVPYDRGWNLKVDGHDQEKFILSAGMTGVLLPKGKHTIEMTYSIPYFKIGLFLSLLGFVSYIILWFFKARK